MTVRKDGVSRAMNRTTLRTVLPIFAMLIVAGCVSMETTVPPVATLSVRGKDTAMLESGRRIYLDNCTRCHVAEPVGKFSVARWPGIIADMGARSHLSPEQNRAVLAYVLAASRTP
jgi:mono/diheme cytochrome c family protein